MVSSGPGAPYHLRGMVGASVRHYDTRHTERVSASFGSGCRQIMPSLWGRVAALFFAHLGAGFGAAPVFEPNDNAPTCFSTYEA